MDKDPIRRHFFYRIKNGDTILETDAPLLPPPIGAMIHLPSPLNEEEVVAYRVKEVQFAPQSPERINIYIELEQVDEGGLAE